MSLSILSIFVNVILVVEAYSNETCDKPLWIELNKEYFNETYGGDMILLPNKNNKLSSKYLPTDSGLIWPNRKIPYQLSKDFSEKQKNLFNKAVNWFETRTCVRWVKRNGRDRDYVDVRKLGGCRAVVGRSGGAQLLSLANDCFNSLSTIIHEMMHSSGFIHEHQRPDRNRYVTINYKNIQPGMENQFNINVDKKYYYDYKLPYDVHSVMHYTENAFSNGNGKTIVAKSGQKLSCLQYSSCPTDLDARKINAIYRC